MTDTDIFKGLQSILIDKLQVASERVIPSARLKEDLDADSLGAMEIVMSVEDLYNIEILDEELHALVTVSDIIELAKSKLEVLEKTEGLPVE